MAYEYTFNKKKALAIVIGIIIAISVGVTLSLSIKIVDTGYRGVLLHFQEPDGVKCDEKTGVCVSVKPPLREGLHIVTPIQDDIVEIEVRTQKFEKIASSASKDLQEATTTVAVNFKVNPDSVHLLYATVGLDYANRIIQPAVDETVKQITARYNAEELITKRETVKGEIEQSLGQRLAKFYLQQELVSITEFRFSSQFAQAIEAKVTADQNAKTAQNVVSIKEAEARQAEAIALGEKLANIQRAEGVKQSQILEAEGKSQATLIQAEADAKKIRLITDMISNNPEYIEYLRILQWNGHLPEVLLTDNGTPLIQIPTKITSSGGK